MAYPVFPTIQKPSWQYNLNPEDPAIIFTPEDGPDVSRARTTKMKISYLYHWNAMPQADFDVFFDFYQNTVKGSSLICTWNGVDGRIILSQKPVKSSPNHWAFEITFRGV